MEADRTLSNMGETANKSMDKASSLRLGIFIGQAFFRHGDEITTDRAFYRFLEEIASCFASATLLVPVHDRSERGPYAVSTDRFTVRPLPPINQYSVASVVSSVTGTVRTFLSARHEFDLLWIGGPHILGPILTFLCWLTRTPHFLVIRQNLAEQVRHKGSGLRGRISVLVARLVEGHYRRLAKKRLTLTVGHAMFAAYKGSSDTAPVVPIVISLVRDELVSTPIGRRDATVSSRADARLLAVGRLSGEKGFDILLETVHRLIGEGRKVTLDIVGTGPEKVTLEELVSRLGLQRHVFLRGYVPFGEDLLDYYRQADVFVLPSRSGEGVPQVLLEAMANGTPAVAAAVEGIPYLVDDGENGLLVPSEDPDALARRIGELLDDPSLAERLGMNGREFVAAHTLEKERSWVVSNILRYWPQGLRGPAVRV
jgi:glycosyltransferase involved in cell wall biosynthesis